ncbi:hypothetical protein NFT50_004835 [Salmonella enterica]|nr:hypothetical protein [Salmonella enterica]EJH7016132.1 hypothetical protein [Salmonella enterica]EJH7437811.1 hypothetical protein [Salmonella enterica]EJH7877106.1 hypothetical protein [Salmonella enterica]EJH7880982.1 hypothetical protein [Salmonella enterica]
MNNITSCADLLAGVYAADLSPDERRQLFDDAEYHRQSLTDSIALTGELLEGYAAVARAGHRPVDIGNDTAEKLGRFLISTAVLLDALHCTIAETAPPPSRVRNGKAKS